MAKSTNVRYTYATFAHDAITLSQGGEIENMEAFGAKARALLESQENRAEYARANPPKREAKGPSEASLAMADKIAKVLNSKPMTAAEINAALNADIPAMTMNNFIKLIPDAEKLEQKVTRQIETVLDNGEKGVETRTYAAYVRR